MGAGWSLGHTSLLTATGLLELELADAAFLVAGAGAFEAPNAEER